MNFIKLNVYIISTSIKYNANNTIIGKKNTMESQKCEFVVMMYTFESGK